MQLSAPEEVSVVDYSAKAQGVIQMIREYTETTEGAQKIVSNALRDLPGIQASLLAALRQEGLMDAIPAELKPLVVDQPMDVQSSEEAPHGPRRVLEFFQHAQASRRGALEPVLNSIATLADDTSAVSAN